MRRLLVLLAVLWVCDGVKFGQLCSSNPSNSRRTSDRWGQGQYGAGRGTRLHQGLDIKCSHQRGHQPVRTGSLFQAVLREAGPNLRNGEEGAEDRHHAAHAERLSGNHLTHPRPDVRQARPHTILLIHLQTPSTTFITKEAFL
uniref:Secreted protein n=1 Tax=Astatotilapia calliptera TaxID=8154 RepID=A0AAX7V6W2_ASTCA